MWEYVVPFNTTYLLPEEEVTDLTPWYGDKFTSSTWSPNVRNIRNDHDQSDLHICRGPGCEHKRPKKDCYDVKKLHFAYCLGYRPNSFEILDFCGDRLSSWSGGCSIHPRVQGFNECFQDIRANRLTRMPRRPEDILKELSEEFEYFKKKGCLPTSNEDEQEFNEAEPWVPFEARKKLIASMNRDPTASKAKLPEGSKLAPTFNEIVKGGKTLKAQRAAQQEEERRDELTRQYCDRIGTTRTICKFLTDVFILVDEAVNGRQGWKQTTEAELRVDQAGQVASNKKASTSPTMDPRKMRMQERTANEQQFFELKVNAGRQKKFVEVEEAKKKALEDKEAADKEAANKNIRGENRAKRNTHVDDRTKAKNVARIAMPPAPLADSTTTKGNAAIIAAPRHRPYQKPSLTPSDSHKQKVQRDFGPPGLHKKAAPLAPSVTAPEFDHNSFPPLSALASTPAPPTPQPAPQTTQIPQQNNNKYQGRRRTKWLRFTGFKYFKE